MEYVATQLRQAARRPRFAPDERPQERPRIISMIFCGPSGCGKTELAEAIQEELGGAALPFVKVDANTFKDPTAVTRATGASAGFEGCSDGNSLPDQLADLLEDPEKKSLLKLNKSTTKYREGVDALNKRIALEGPYKGPPLIFIFIDEIDKADSEFLVALNNLLDQGRMVSARGRVFAPPKETTLLFVFTANYADDALCRLAHPHTATAQGLVVDDMVAHGLQHCTIERFGEIVPFYPLTGHQLREILHRKLDLYLRRGHELSDNYGPLQYENGVKELLIDRMARMANMEGGVRNGQKLLFKNLDQLFEESLDTLEQLQKQKPGTLRVFIEHFSMERLQSQLDGNLKRLLDKTTNRQELQMYRERKEHSITALGLRAHALGVVALRVLSLPVQINVNVLVHSSVPEVEQENRELRDTITELSELDDCDDHYGKVRRILDKRGHLLRNDDEWPGPPRVEEMLVEEPKSPELKRKADTLLPPNAPLKKTRVQNDVVGVSVTSTDDTLRTYNKIRFMFPPRKTQVEFPPPLSPATAPPPSKPAASHCCIDLTY